MLKNNIEINVRKDQEQYGFAEIVSFLSDYSGEHYTAPDKAGDKAEYMTEIKNRGRDARQKFIAFGQKVAAQIPGLEYVSCSNWMNQNRMVERYLWVELKNNEWKDFPQSVSLSIEQHDDVYPGEGYYLSVRSDTRDVSSKEADYKRQLRLLDYELLDGMTYRTEYKDKKDHYHGTDTDTVKALCENGTILKLQVVEAIENLPKKDADGTVFEETVKAAREILPLYQYVMQQEDWWSSLTEYDPEIMAQFEHNMILYGPPGTGKTYNSIIYAVAICEGKPIENLRKEPYGNVLLRYNELREAGRIAFTTFHQSYGYEEFIEGIKPRLGKDSETLGYTIEDGVFKEFCNRAKAVRVKAATSAEIKAQPRIWGMFLGGSRMAELKKRCFDNDEIRLGRSDVDGEFVTDDKESWNVKHIVSDFKNSMEVGDVIVVEKNNKSIDAIGIITGDYVYDKTIGEYPRSRAVKWLVKDIDQDMIPFLPNGRKKLSGLSVYAFDYIGIDVIIQILNKYLRAPVMEVERETKPYVFIIDEINRGNISKIFGELITLIEDKKRSGAAEAMEAILPYSGEPFSVPQNVYIIGTMNTADRSIALMDTALRRRFEFEEMMPDTSVLERLDIGKITFGDEELNIARTLDVINERIEYLFDREHTIGHAFFTKLANDPSIQTLASIFEKKVIPLLQEYFYEDYEKIQLVLGDNTKDDEFKFILDRPVKVKKIFNGNPDIDLPEKGYEIQHSAFRKLESYKQIDKDL